MKRLTKLLMCHNKIKFQLPHHLVPSHCCINELCMGHNLNILNISGYLFFKIFISRHPLMPQKYFFLYVRKLNSIHLFYARILWHGGRQSYGRSVFTAKKNNNGNNNDNKTIKILILPWMTAQVSSKCVVCVCGAEFLKRLNIQFRILFKVSRYNLNFWARTRLMSNWARELRWGCCRNGTDRWDRRQGKISTAGEVIDRRAQELPIVSLEFVLRKSQGFPLSLLPTAGQVSPAADGMFSSIIANLASQLLTLTVFGS